MIRVLDGSNVCKSFHLPHEKGSIMFGPHSCSNDSKITGDRTVSFPGSNFDLPVNPNTDHSPLCVPASSRNSPYSSK